MTLITPGYLAEQRALHANDSPYGSRGYNWAFQIAGIALLENCQTILDYGCGKGALGRSLRQYRGFRVQDYDPAVSDYVKSPSPADLVVSMDVIEHVEPECLDAVIADLHRLTKRLLFVGISTRLAGRTLSDGRNAHISLHDGEWWREKFEAKPIHFKTRRVWKTGEDEWVSLLAKR